ncbi:MAG: hypothetical protein QHJ82_16650 [Verrucomicrobiota bacterium]|nr:hypothetical protein [Verrucomicrobiota bacterium]
MEKASYAATINPVGVSDISGVLRPGPKSDLFQRITARQPLSAEEQTLKSILEYRSAATLETLRNILNG